MLTISSKVEEIVQTAPYLRQALHRGLINYSSLAREIRKQVEQDLGKMVSVGAITIALQRYASSLKHTNVHNPAEFLDNMSLRSGLHEITVKNSPTLMSALAEFLEKTQQDRSIFFVFTTGIYETTIIMSNNVVQQVKQVVKNELVESEIADLTAISLQRVNDHLKAIGVLAYPLQIIAWQGISVVEIVTTLNEEMIIVKDSDVDLAASAIRQALQKISKQL